MPTTFVILHSISGTAPGSVRLAASAQPCCLALTLFLLAWLIFTGRLSIAEAGAALVAIRLLAGQVQSGFTGVQAIFESGSFIDDLDGFLTLAPAAEGGVARDRAAGGVPSHPGRCGELLLSRSQSACPAVRQTSRSTAARSSPWSVRTVRARPRWPR